MDCKKYFLLIVSIFYFLPSVANASIPTWRILWIIFPKVNVTHTDGVNYNFTLTQDEITKIREMSERVERFIEGSTGNAVDIEMTVVESTGTVRSLTENTDHIFVGEDDFTSDVKRELEHAEEEDRPYQIKVATFRLDGDNEKVTNWYGLGIGTYARVHFYNNTQSSDFEVKDIAPHPEEVWIHELIHCFESLFDSLGTMAGLHDNAKYGYEYNNGWYRWYHDVLAGQVKDPTTGEYVGIKSDMWQHLPPSPSLERTVYWKGHTYKIIDTVRTWSGAKSYCESLNGHLVTITSEEEQNVVANLLKQNSIWNYYGYWMGAQKDTKWHWLTGEAFKYTKFSEGQPDGSGNYLEMYNYPDQGNWDDTTANANVEIQGGLYPHGIICEWEYIVKPQVSILTANHLPGGVLNTTYTQTLNTEEASMLNHISGTLPNGLTLSTSGLLSGIPTQTGSFDFTVKAENNSEYVLKTFTLDITPEIVAPVITTVDLRNANVGDEYYQNLEISGSSATWSIIDKNLPTNLSLSQTGEITGKTLTEGSYNFTVRAKNSAGYNDKTFILNVVNNAFPATEMEQDEIDKQEDEDTSHHLDEEQTNNNTNTHENNKSESGGCNSAKIGFFTLLAVFMKKINRRFYCMKKFLLCVILIMLPVSVAFAGATEDLLEAVTNKNTTPEQIVKLIKAGADVNINDNKGSPALILAVRNNSNPQVITELIKAGADINAKDSSILSGTAICWAFSTTDNFHFEVVKVLVDAGADVNDRNRLGTSVLMLAACNRHPEIIKFLLNAGADVNAKTSSGNTALISAAGYNKNPEVIKLLLNAGADVNARHSGGSTALTDACGANKNPEVIKVLLKAGADVKAKTQIGATAKDTAKNNKNPQIRKMAEVFDYFGNFETVLLNAIQENAKPEAISTIIDLGVNINTKNQNGATALMIAAANTSYPEVITILNQAGINVNEKAKDGQTALMYAARFNKNPGVIKALIKAGADVKATDSLFFGKTAKDWAIQSNANQEIIKILEGL